MRKDDFILSFSDEEKMVLNELAGKNVRRQECAKQIYAYAEATEDTMLKETYHRLADKLQNMEDEEYKIMVSLLPLEYTTFSGEHTVVFLNWDGSIIKEETVPHGASATPPDVNPVKPSDEKYDYVFAGWNQDGGTIVADTNLTAVFTEKPKTHKLHIWR